VSGGGASWEDECEVERASWGVGGDVDGSVSVASIRSLIAFALLLSLILASPLPSLLSVARQ
jgi:hypothetical protein